MEFTPDNCADCGCVLQSYKGVWFDNGLSVVLICNKCYGRRCDEKPRFISFDEEHSNLERALNDLFEDI